MHKFFVTSVLVLFIGVPIHLALKNGTGLEAQNLQRNQPWASQTTLAAADATKALRASPGATNQLIVTTVNCTILTSAAQTVDIESSDGTVEVLRIAVSAGVNVSFQTRLNNGIALPLNTSLRIQPGAAGPSVHCVAEGYIRGGF